MLPTIFGISTYTIAATLGFASFVLVFVLSLDYKLKINRREVSNVIIIMVGAMGIGVFLAWFLDGLFKIPDRGALQLWISDEEGFRLLGITWYGMLIGGLGGLSLLHWLVNKISIKKKDKLVFQTDRKTYLNVAAPAMALAHFWGRIGCFLVGCCYGRVSIFGWVYPNGTHGQLPRFPVQLFEAGILLGIFFFLFFIKNKKIRNNSLYIYLGGYAITRFILEFFRGDFRGGLFAFMGLSPAQFISVCLMIFVVSMVMYENVFLKRKKEIATLSQEALMCSDNEELNENETKVADALDLSAEKTEE